MPQPSRPRSSTPVLRFVRPLRAIGAALLVASCGGDSKPCRLRVDAAKGALVLADCGATTMALAPRAFIDGTWQSGAACRAGATATTLVCSVGDAGTVEATLDGDVVTTRLRAARALSLGGLALDGTATLPGSTSWLSNGFQSWSSSGMVALAPRPSDSELSSALLLRGDSEVVRSGNELSWWYTVAGGGATALFGGALTADRFRPWAQLSGSGAALDVRFASGGAGEAITVAAGAVVDGERWRIEAGADASALLERYGKALPTRRANLRVAPELGWNSWYELWDTVDETALRAIAPLAATKLAPHLPVGARPRFVIDDGWQQAWGTWLPNAKFPSGLDGVARELRTAGFEPGVWLAPLLVHVDSEVARSHPEWLVEGAEYPHLKNGRMKVLDVTHPDAAAHLEGVIRRIVSWGYTLLKIDFLFAGTYEGRRREAVTGMQAYHLALRLIRRAAGEGVVLVAVGAPPVPSLPYADVWRLGNDIAVEPVGPSWFFVADQARSIAVRWPVCLATLCDADPPLQRTLPQSDVEAGGWVAALAGGGLFFSDDLRRVPSERAAWGVDAYRVGLALGGQPARPIDLFPAAPAATLPTAIGDSVLMQNRHVVPAQWRLPDGKRLILNLSDVPLTVGVHSIPPHGATLTP